MPPFPSLPNRPRDSLEDSVRNDQPTDLLLKARALPVAAPSPVETIAVAAAAPGATGLRANAIGLPQVLFQSITAMAPASAVAFTLSAAVPFTGGSLPLAVLIALVVSALLAMNIAQLAVHLPSAGGLYTYISRGLGVVPGFLAGWLLALAQILVVPLQLLVIGPVASNAVWTYSHIASPWWLWALLGTGLVFGLTRGGIRLSTNAGIILGVGEILIFLALAALLIVSAGAHNTGATFTPHYSREGGLGGWVGVLHGMIFAFLAFGGAESAAPLAEETANPRRTIPLAIVLSTLLIGLFYVICSYAGVIGWGLTDLTAYTASPNPWAVLGRNVSALLALLVVVAILKSAIANANAGVNAGTRILYAMGRAGVLPRGLAHLHPRHRTPETAIVLTLLVGVLLTVWSGVAYGTVSAFGLVATVMTILFLVLYIAVCLSVIAYYRREQAQDFSPWRHVLLPAVPTAALFAPLAAQVYPQPAFPLNLAGPLSLAWLAIGIAVALYLRRRQPAALARGGQLLGGDDA